MRFHSLKDRLARVTRAIRQIHPQRSASSTSEAGAPPQKSDSAQVDRAERPERGELAVTAAELARSREERVRAWRRRVLLKKGARIHAESLSRGDRCSLAMLDAQGIVVAWYDDSNDCSRVGVHVVDRHVSQFYVPADLADNLPSLNLLSAAICGGNTQQGWRRLPSGAIIWGTTVIEAVALKDGRLQGFTHVVRPAEGPRADVRLQVRQGRESANLHWGVDRVQRRAVQVSVAA